MIVNTTIEPTIIVFMVNYIIPYCRYSLVHRIIENNINILF